MKNLIVNNLVYLIFNNTFLILIMLFYFLYYYFLVMYKFNIILSKAINYLFQLSKIFIFYYCIIYSFNFIKNIYHSIFLMNINFYTNALLYFLLINYFVSVFINQFTLIIKFIK